MKSINEYLNIIFFFFNDLILLNNMSHHLFYLKEIGMTKDFNGFTFTSLGELM